MHNDFAGQFIPPLFWITLAVLSGRELPGWGWMWVLALSIYFGCKWITFWPFRFTGTIGRRLGYLFACTAMNARGFFTAPSPPKPQRSQWVGGAIKTIAGAGMIWVLPRLLVDRSTLLAGWCAMVGIALLLHFGLFDLLARGWRARGIACDPLMDRPTRAASLSDFWGRRWNSGFRDLAHDVVFVPSARIVGVTGATAIVFILSGLIHDFVISLPARGGYGLPTLYFVIQGIGMWMERRWGRRMRRNREQARGLNGMLQRVYAIVVVVLPLPLLFHPPFVHRVIVPFLHVIGGLP